MTGNGNGNKIMGMGGNVMPKVIPISSLEEIEQRTSV